MDELVHGAMGILILVWLVLFWKPMREVNKAMREDSVIISGSKLSFAKPLKMVIRKRTSDA